jgi:hypothetical protein
VLLCLHESTKISRLEVIKHEGKVMCYFFLHESTQNLRLWYNQIWSDIVIT